MPNLLFSYSKDVIATNISFFNNEKAEKKLWNKKN